MAMRTVRSDSFLWIHGAGLAAVPLLLELCWLGLAAGDPLLPWGLDWLPVAIAGAVPVLAVQWGRPFYPFAIAGLTLRPAALAEVQLKILQRWRSWPIKAIAAVGAIALVGTLGFLYRWAAIASDVTPFGPRWQGLLVAAIAFLLANLLAQMGLASLWVALTPTATLAQLEPVAADTIDATFTRLGVPLSRLLPLLDGFEEEVTMAGAAIAPPDPLPETEIAPEPEAEPQPETALILDPALEVLEDEEEGEDTLIAPPKFQFGVGFGAGAEAAADVDVEAVPPEAVESPEGGAIADPAPESIPDPIAADEPPGEVPNEPEHHDLARETDTALAEASDTDMGTDVDVEVETSPETSPDTDSNPDSAP